MDELIKVTQSENGMTVDGRELHTLLEVGTKFTDWIQERIRKFGFVENEDFSVTITKTGERQNVVRHDYELTIGMAKELCMVENNERGREARKHFIEIERRYKQQQLDISQLTPELQMFHQMFQSVAKTQLQLTQTQQKLNQVSETVEVIQETFLQRDKDWRKQINSLMAGAAFRTKTDYADMRTESYRQLEERAHCDLDTRLRNLKKRMEDAGATKTQVKDTNRMDVIECEPRLKEIYSTIVKELSIGSLSVVR